MLGHSLRDFLNFIITPNCNYLSNNNWKCYPLLLDWLHGVRHRKFKGEGLRVWLFVLELFLIHSDFVIIAKYTENAKQNQNKFIRKKMLDHISSICTYM